jgi:hypothetical protein
MPGYRASSIILAVRRSGLSISRQKATVDRFVVFLKQHFPQIEFQRQHSQRLSWSRPGNQPLPFME